jgi:DNA polymerase bacteriophage-type
MRLAFLDYETQSEQPIEHGLKKYMEHPSTRALTCVVKVDGVLHKFDNPHEQKERLAAVVEGRIVVAHNASFDAQVHHTVLKLTPVEWLDTLPRARAAGLPGGLDKLSLAVGGRGKDKNGDRLIKMLCILKPGQKPPAYGAAHELLLDYNVQDVEELEFIYERVKDFGEPDVIRVDRIVNDRGIPVDRGILETLSKMFEINAAEQREAFAKTTGGINPSSPKQVIAWLASNGFNVDGINKPAVLALLSRPEDFYSGEGDLGDSIETVREAIMARKDAVAVGRGKVDAMLQVLDSDGRIRDQLVYYGAHTGRWSGRKMQPHNMPVVVGAAMDVKSIPLTYEGVKTAVDTYNAKMPENERVGVSAMLSVILRTAVRAKNLLVADYASVEARGLAWTADESAMLRRYNDPTQSLYYDIGKEIFGRDIDKHKDYIEYALAKSVILGCGYGMSGGRFNDLLSLRGVSLEPLERAGITPQECVKIYRKTYPRVPLVWREFGEACMAAVSGEPTRAGKCLFTMVGNDLHAVLPSGRPLVYRNGRIELVVPGYCRMLGMPEVPVPTVVYDGPRMRGFLYGGKICENVIQAMCRDLMAQALVKCEAAGLNPVLHIHDEIVCEAAPERFDEFLEIMGTPPAWASEFPLLVEGYSGPVWTKNSTGYTEGKNFRGMKL